MMFRKLPAAVAAASLALSSIAAHAAPVARAAAPAAEESQLRGTLLWLLLALVAGVALFLLLDDNSDPVSP